jgi:hypothetical protein
VPAAPHAIRKITITSGASSSLTLERQGGAWAILDAAGKRTPVDDEAMRAWLEDLTATRAAAIVPLGAPAAATPTTARLELALDAGDPITLLLLGAPEKDHVLVARPGEPIALAVHPDVARDFVPDAAQFHDRTILSFEPSSLAAIEFSGEGGDEKAARGESTDDWTLTAPLAIAGDRSAVGAVRDTASALHATRVLPPSALATPRRRLTLVLDPPPTAPAGSPPIRHVLDLGARLDDGGCAIRREGREDVAYAIDRDTCDALDVHLATRTVFAVDDITAIQLEGGTRWERHGPVWYAAGSARVPDEQGDKLDRLVDALHEADVLGYGAPPAGTHTIILSTATTPVRLMVAPTSFSLDGRAVKYRLAPGVCADFPTICK